MTRPRYDVKIAQSFPPQEFRDLSAGSAAITISAHLGMPLERTRQLVDHASQVEKWEGRVRGATVTVTKHHDEEEGR